MDPAACELSETVTFKATGGFGVELLTGMLAS